MAEETHKIDGFAGQPMTLPTLESLGWKKDGYEFYGWGKSKTTRLIEAPDGGTVLYNDDTELYAIWHSMDYFYLKAYEAGAKFKLKWSSAFSAPTINLEYSTDYKKTWTPFATNTEYTLENVGDTMYLRAVDKNTTFAMYHSIIHSWSFTINDKKIAAGGNIMSLLDKSMTQTSVPEYCFAGLFIYNTALMSAPEMPATEVNAQCYCEMFKGCTNLIKPPSILPAQTLSYQCYFRMFADCTNLETLPTIAATTFNGNGSMNEMFCDSNVKNTYIKLSISPKNINNTDTNLMFKNHKQGLSIEVDFSSWSPVEGTGTWLASDYAYNDGVFICPNPEQVAIDLRYNRTDSTIPQNWSISASIMST